MKDLLEKIQMLYPNVKLYGYETDYKIELCEIRVPKDQRGKGIGSEIIRMIQDYAKKVGKPIVLFPQPERGKKKALEDFYTNLGFVYNKGRHSDNRISSPFGKTMYWKFKEWLNYAENLD